VALGVAGISPIWDYRGSKDQYGYQLRVTSIAVADEVSGAAELVMGKLGRVPVALVRGYGGPRGEGSMSELLRKQDRDLFR
jgi:coenzyme F420-0:L-glutamate ligase/coenzyme F420-1:gamma-L-glutamate ligase